MTTQTFLANITEMIGALAVVMLFSLIPKLKTVPVVGFKYPRREATFATVLAVLFILFSLILSLTPGLFSASVFQLPESVNGIFRETILAILMVLIVFGVLRYRQQPIRSMGWHPALWRIGLQIGIALAFLSLFLQAKIFTIMDGLTRAEGYALALFLILSLAEETVFRGYIQMRFRSFLGERWGWLLTALIYVIWQLPFYLDQIAFDLSFGLLVSTLILRSLLLGWMMQKSRHILAPGIYHAISAWMNFI